MYQYTGLESSASECIYVLVIYVQHCKNKRVVLTNFGHLSCPRNCYKSLNKQKAVSLEMAISLSYHKLFTTGVDSLMMLKWSHATDITNMGQFNHHFFTVKVCLLENNGFGHIQAYI